VSAAGAYELIVTPPAARAIGEQLSEAVAAALLEFMTTALIREPRRVGRPLRRELTGIWSARRGTYSILYRVRDDTGEVMVLRVEHRAVRVPASVGRLGCRAPQRLPEHTTLGQN